MAVLPGSEQERSSLQAIPAYTGQSDVEQTIARSKSYIGAAVLTFLLYYLFWLPGLIVNWMYYAEAKQNEEIAGRSLPGVGCLAIMLWLNILWILLLVGLLILVFGSIPS